MAFVQSVKFLLYIGDDLLTIFLGNARLRRHLEEGVRSQTFEFEDAAPHGLPNKVPIGERRLLRRLDFSANDFVVFRRRRIGSR